MSESVTWERSDGNQRRGRKSIEKKEKDIEKPPKQENKSTEKNRRTNDEKKKIEWLKIWQKYRRKNGLKEDHRKEKTNVMWHGKEVKRKRG